MTLPIGYSLRAEIPAVSEYLQLRKIAGLSPFDEESAQVGLSQSLYSVVIQNHAQQTIGMGRLVGDGGCFVIVVDIAVAPEHQGQGIGTCIMHALMDYVDTELPKSCFVSLLADLPANRLYEKFGFTPTAPRSIAMAYRDRNWR